MKTNLIFQQILNNGDRKETFISVYLVATYQDIV